MGNALLNMSCASLGISALQPLRLCQTTRQRLDPRTTSGISCNGDERGGKADLVPQDFFGMFSRIGKFPSVKMYQELVLVSLAEFFLAGILG